LAVAEVVGVGGGREVAGGEDGLIVDVSLAVFVGAVVTGAVGFGVDARAVLFVGVGFDGVEVAVGPEETAGALGLVEVQIAVVGVAGNLGVFAFAVF
jgi:hypothetical protein